MYYYLLLFCIFAGIIKGFFFTNANPNHKPSKDLLDFLIPGIYRD